VWLPPAYFRDTTGTLPVVAVVAEAGAGTDSGAWPGNDVPDSDRPANGCVVFVRISHAAVAAGLSMLPAVLVRDLRVAAHSWGVVGIGAAVPTANHLTNADPGHFGPMVAVGTPGGGADLPGALTQVLSQEPPVLAPPLVLPTLASAAGR
jgi:hypothetical protein